MKKGFTLIELLAVIVILAIIALIATPIILGIINDAKEESNERSIELYASAAKNAIAAYQLNNPSAPTSFDQLDIEYDGDVVCTTQELYEDGSIYLADCTVNGDEVEYTYGEQQVTQVYKPQYYYFGYDWNGKVGETAAPSNPSSVPPTDKSFYLGYDVEAGIVSAAYACFTKNETEYCLNGVKISKIINNTGGVIGTINGEIYDVNRTVLVDAFKDVENACSAETEGAGPSRRAKFICNADGLEAFADSTGYVFVHDDITACVADGGDFGCFEILE